MSSKVSLRTKIIGMVFGVILLVGFGAWFNMQELANQYEETTIASFSNLANSVSMRIAEQFSQSYKDIQAFATGEAIRSGNSERITTKLNQLVKAYKLYDFMMVVDTDGHFIAANTTNAVGKNTDIQRLKKENYSQEPWFQAPLNEQFTEDKGKDFAGTYVQPWIRDPIIKNAFGEERLGSSFTAPIKDENGKVIAIITNRVSQHWLTDILSSANATTSGNHSEGPLFELVDNQGLLLYAQWGKSKAFMEEDFLKKNISSSEIIKLSLARSSGATIQFSDVLKTQAVASYSNFDGPKWIESMGWHLVLIDRQDQVMAPVLKAKRNFYVFFAINIFIAMAFAILFTIVLSKKMNVITSELSKNSNQVSKESAVLAVTATNLSESSTQQAAALQETVAAVDEIFAMVEKNADAANRSKDYSDQSRQAAEKGKHIVDRMLTAIGEIDSANHEVSQRMEISNKDLSEITTLIKEIGSKTKVINDIVFQTKLLSFNASVEAARAGEYGKGFAVVAEEVGNLAQMSGSAATEISTLLDESVRKVETIVDETKRKIDQLMAMNKEKVEAGSHTANECASALEEILQNVGNVDSMVSEIAVASREQSLGIKEISKAVGQMEQVIQKNTTMASSSSTSSEHLKTQADALEHIIHDLQIIVSGHSSKIEVQSSPGVADNVISLKEAKKKRIDAKVEKKPKKEDTKKWTVSKKGNSTASTDEKVGTGKTPKFDKVTVAHPIGEPSKFVVGGETIPAANDPGFRE